MNQQGTQSQNPPKPQGKGVVFIVSYITKYLIYSQVQNVEGPVHSEDKERCLFKSAGEQTEKKDSSTRAGSRQAKVIKTRSECITYCEQNGLHYRISKSVTSI